MHRRGHVGQFQPHLRIGSAEFAGDVGHDRVAGDGGVADPEDCLGAGGEESHGILGDFHASQDRLRLLEQIAPGFGQPDPARRALQQLDAESLLQFQDDAAHRRLGHGQSFGRAVEVQLLGNRDEGGQVLQIVTHTDADFVSIADKMIISHAAPRCLRLLPNGKRAAEAANPEWINNLNDIVADFPAKAKSRVTAGAYVACCALPRQWSGGRGGSGSVWNRREATR